MNGIRTVTVKCKMSCLISSHLNTERGFGVYMMVIASLDVKVTFGYILCT